MLSHATLRANLDAVAATVLGAAAVGLTAADQGAYFAPAWGWSAFGLLLATALALAFRDRLAVGRLEVLFVAGVVLILLWTALSTAWSASVPGTVEELERTVIYVAAVPALVALVPATRLPYFLGGLLAAVVGISAYSLAGRLNDLFSSRPLSGPIGYWNALGLLVSVGLLLALGFATAQIPGKLRVAAAASVPILAATLYLTKSRGASAALLAGLFTFAFLHPLLRPRRRRAAALAVLLLVLAALAVGIARAGSPGALLGKTYGAFQGPAAPNGRPNETFLTFSGNNRSEYWRVAAKEYGAHPWLGSGAGTFELYWNRYRRTIYGSRDAHSLYLETLAELGPVGLLLLVATLALPFTALRGTRREPLLAAATGAYVAFLLHTGIDWDWEMPAVTITGLFCGGSVVVAAASRRRRVSIPSRSAALGTLAALASFTVVAYVGNLAEAESSKAAARGDYARAESTARTATRWTPWSSQAWGMRGEAQLAAGDASGARASFRTGLRKDPQEWKLWYGLARASRGAARERAIAEAARLNRYSLDVLAFRRR